MVAYHEACSWELGLASGSRERPELTSSLPVLPSVQPEVVGEGAEAGLPVRRRSARKQDGGAHTKKMAAGTQKRAVRVAPLGTHLSAETKEKIWRNEFVDIWSLVSVEQAATSNVEAHLADTNAVRDYPLLKTTCHGSFKESQKTVNTLNLEGISAAFSDIFGKVVQPNTTERSTDPQKKKPIWRSKHDRVKGKLPSLVPGLVLVKKKLNWQLMMEGYSAHLTLEEQRGTLREAFRMWSEVTPLLFMEVSPKSELSADITLGFGTGRHFGCSQVFEMEGNELAHSTSDREIHLNDDQHFTASGQHGISLLKVAVHEIGHVLGLHHSTRADSVMSPSYNTEGSSVELSSGDRRDIQQLYGVCEGPFDAIFDWLWTKRSPRGTQNLRFNTFFLRRRWSWLYENKNNRTRPRDPRLISIEWRIPLQTKLDAVLHIWSSTKQETYFFAGAHVWIYHKSERIFGDSQGLKVPQLIHERFPGITGPIDTAFFNYTQKSIYFFTGLMVTVFDIKTHQPLGGYPRRITEMFPPVRPRDHPIGNLDAAYYSYTHQALFFFKGVYFWKVVGSKERSQNRSLPVNGVLPSKRVSEQWFDICDVTSV
ncbi:matrix metalloproteinase-21-like [Rhinoderma darwinii]|uniref:matrix metalloproteinase-21-like n=1 Tax=Rhinoderma darwinii TaxID=43563 RepID=UPI003F675CBB